MKCHTAEHARLNDDMFFYRQLRGQQRIQLHVCLFLSFLLTALLSLLWQLLIYNDRVENPWIETFMVKQQVRLIWLLDDVLFINCLGMGNVHDFILFCLRLHICVNDYLFVHDFLTTHYEFKGIIKQRLIILHEVIGDVHVFTDNYVYVYMFIGYIHVNSNYLCNVSWC